MVSQAKELLSWGGSHNTCRCFFRGFVSFWILNTRYFIICLKGWSNNSTEILTYSLSCSFYRSYLCLWCKFSILTHNLQFKVTRPLEMKIVGPCDRIRTFPKGFPGASRFLSVFLSWTATMMTSMLRHFSWPTPQFSSIQPAIFKNDNLSAKCNEALIRLPSDHWVWRRWRGGGGMDHSLFFSCQVLGGFW